MVSLVKSPGPAVSVGDVFRRAAEVLRERGHCKGSLGDFEGRVCLYGALDVALDWMGLDTTTSPELYWSVADRMIRDMEPGYSTEREFEVAAAWNDEPSREQTEVEKFLLQVADRADVEGL